MFNQGCQIIKGGKISRNLLIFVEGAGIPLIQIYCADDNINTNININTRFLPSTALLLLQ